MHDRSTQDLSMNMHAPRAEALTLDADTADCSVERAALWAYLATVRVIAPGACRSETRTVRGLFCARNHHEARLHAGALAAEKARELGHVVDVSLTRLW